ncbi:hypothetical protein NDU88_001026, partial [Pleurodeles waltl]
CHLDVDRCFMTSTEHIQTLTVCVRETDTLSLSFKAPVWPYVGTSICLAHTSHIVIALRGEAYMLRRFGCYSAHFTVVFRTTT